MCKKFRVFHHIDQQTIDAMYNEYSPVFVLSTGRSGSKFLHTIMSQCDDIQSSHEAFPTLQYFSNFAFHNQEKQEVLRAMFNASRMELILDAYNNNKLFFESNQCHVFFAYAIADLFKKAKFIHLIRHPGDFICSAIKKGWHLNDTIWESGRVKMLDEDQWQKQDQVQKLAWSWQITNDFIRCFFDSQDHERILTVKLEDLTSQKESVSKVMTFIGSKNIIKDEFIIQLQGNKVNELFIHPFEPVNMRKVKDYPAFATWSQEEKGRISKYLDNLSLYYDYEI